MSTQEQTQEPAIYEKDEGMQSVEIYKITEKDRKNIYEIILNDLSPFEWAYGETIKEIVESSNTTEDLFGKLEEPDGVLSELQRTVDIRTTTPNLRQKYIRKDINGYFSKSDASPPPLEAQASFEK